MLDTQQTTETGGPKIDLGNAFDWMNKGQQASEPITEEPVQPSESETPATPPIQTQTVESEAKPETAITETPADKPPLPPIVEELGGEEGMRQFLPLARALRESATLSDEEASKTVFEALQKTLSGDQLNAVLWEQYDRYGELFAKQYIEENAKFLEELGYVKPEAETSDDDFDDDEPLSPRERRLKDERDQAARRAQELEASQNQNQQQSAQQQAEQIRANAEAQMFGTVVNKAFEQLEWNEADAKRAYQIAVREFNSDTEAVKLYQAGLKYHQTQQPVLRVDAEKASARFSQYLSEAIAFVEMRNGKTQPAEKKAPIPPTRQEFSSTTKPGGQALDPAPVAVPSDKPTKFFDANDLAARVQESLNKRGAAR